MDSFGRANPIELQRDLPAIVGEVGDVVNLTIGIFQGERLAISTPRHGVVPFLVSCDGANEPVGRHAPLSKVRSTSTNLRQICRRLLSRLARLQRLHTRRKRDGRGHTVLVGNRLCSTVARSACSTGLLHFNDDAV